MHKLKCTSNESDVDFSNRNHDNSAGEIGAGSVERGAGVVVEGGEPRSEWYAGDIVLDEAVDIDDGNGVAELDAGHQYE